MLMPTSVETLRQIAPPNRLLRLRREFIERIGLTALIVTLFTATLFAGMTVFLVRWVLSSYEGQQRLLGVTETQSRRIDEQEKQLAGLNERIRQMDQRFAGLGEITRDLNDAERSSVRALPLASELWAKYGNGVCLIAGAFELVEPGTDRALRYPENEGDTVESLLVIGTGQLLTYDGNGPIFKQEFEASGFHVGSGYVLTNHHIALEPWAQDRRSQYLIETKGAIPRVTHLLAYFPGHRQPIALKVKSTSKTDDIAVCVLQSKTGLSQIPSLPLDKDSTALGIGKPVVTMGYPTGPDRLLALLPENEAMKLMDQYGASLTGLLDELAKRDLIRPLMTQGHIRDLYRNRIVVDAMSTQGSSGTPMFGETGKVVGVSFAVMAGDATSNFVAGIHGAFKQLRTAGWSAPEN